MTACPEHFGLELGRCAGDAGSSQGSVRQREHPRQQPRRVQHWREQEATGAESRNAGGAIFTEQQVLPCTARKPAPMLVPDRLTVIVTVKVCEEAASALRINSVEGSLTIEWE